jgi:hypothetical protein
MYGGFLRRLEKSKEAWYRAHGMSPPEIFEGPRTPRKMRLPRPQTYTKTTVLDIYAPVPHPVHRLLSYWETEGAGIEPRDFRRSISSIRRKDVISWDPFPLPRIGRLNKCETPYENDIMSFDAFETARRELKHRSDHLASEMDRVEREWTRPPKKDWVKLKGREFSIEYNRFMELQRRESAKHSRLPSDRIVACEQRVE